jgi:hypothetical protein
MVWALLLCFLVLMGLGQAFGQQAKGQKSRSAAADSVRVKARPGKALSADKVLVLNTLCACFDRAERRYATPSDKISDCMLEAFQLEQEAFVKEYGTLTPDSDSSAGQNDAIGAAVGTELAPRCPAFMRVVADKLREAKTGAKKAGK